MLESPLSERITGRTESRLLKTKSKVRAVLNTGLAEIIEHAKNDLEQRKFDSFLILFDEHERILARVHGH